MRVREATPRCAPATRSSSATRRRVELVAAGGRDRRLGAPDAPWSTAAPGTTAIPLMGARDRRRSRCRRWAGRTPRALGARAAPRIPPPPPGRARASGPPPSPPSFPDHSPRRRPAAAGYGCGPSSWAAGPGCRGRRDRHHSHPGRDERNPARPPPGHAGGRAVRRHRLCRDQLLDLRTATPCLPCDPTPAASSPYASRPIRPADRAPRTSKRGVLDADQQVVVNARTRCCSRSTRARTRSPAPLCIATDGSLQPVKGSPFPSGGTAPGSVG